MNEIVCEIEIAAPPETVFDAMVEPGQLAAWWGSEESYRTSNWRVDLRVGGSWSCEARTAQGHLMTVHGVYLAIDRPRVLAYTWNPSWDALPETEVRVTLSAAAGGGTLVRVTHSGFAGYEKSAEGHVQGWNRVLGWLREFLGKAGQR
jgi:uncharacterized protein YndB with AHSA1/START domain